MLELSWDGEWYRRAITTTARRSDRARAPRGASIRSRNRGGAVRRRAARLAERAMDAVRHASRPPPSETILLLTPPFDRANTTGLYPGLRARAAGERRTVFARRDLGRDGAGAARQRRRAVELVPHAQPGQTARARRPDSSATKASRMCWPATSTPQPAGRPRRLVMVHGRVRNGCTGSLESILGLRRHGQTFAIDPCVPAAWDELHDHVGASAHALRDSRRQSQRDAAAAWPPRRRWRGRRSARHPDPATMAGRMRMTVTLGDRAADNGVPERRLESAISPMSRPQSRTLPDRGPSTRPARAGRYRKGTVDSSG